MNATLSKICALLLRDARVDRRIAAALILGELAPRDPAVVKALCTALPAGSKPLKLACLEALGRLRAAQAVPFLLPLLEAADEDLRQGATKILATIGPSAVKPIARQILDASPPARRALLKVLGKVRSAESVRVLISLIRSEHPEATREAARTLVTLSREMTRPEKTRIRAMLEKILKSPAGKTSEPVLSAALTAMGAIALPGSAPTLLKLTSPRYPEAVRRDALIAIAGVLRGRSMPAKIFTGIHLLIQEGPSPALRSAAVEVLGAVDLLPSCLDALLTSLENPDPAVRRFVARKLGSDGLGGAQAVRRLVPLLAGSDPSLREAAAESLAGMPEATRPLTEELLACRHVHHGWTIAHILKRHASRLRKPRVRKVFDAGVQALTHDERLWEPLLYVVRHRDPNLLYTWLMEAAARFKKARKYSEAEACLMPLTRGDHFDSEARYALALAGLRAARAGRSTGRSVAEQPMALVRQLVRDPTFPLVDRLKKERVHLEVQDLYQVGFRLAEGTGEEREAGADLLKTVAARAGASKLGRSARNKLRAEGLAL